MTNLELAIQYCRGRYVILDTNVFLLFIVGGIGVEHISRVKQTRQFLDEDYDLLLSLISQSKVILTPNVLTEASNLLESYSFNGYKIGLLGLKVIIEKYDEIYTVSQDLSDLDSFTSFGLTDSSINYLCQNNVLAITTDLSLFGYLITNSFPVINFNHFRDLV